MALVPKKATAGGALDQRPVTLTNLAYRAWSGTRCQQSAQWLRAWPPPRCAGVPGKGADVVWGPMALRAEIARAEQALLGGQEPDPERDPEGRLGGHMAGLSMDLWKYYDLIDAPTAISFLEKLGLHSGVATALRPLLPRRHRQRLLGQA